MELNQVKLTAKVLSYVERPYKRKDGTDTIYREAIVQVGSSIVKFPVSDKAALGNFINAECDLVIEFYSFGDDISAKARIVAASE